MGSERDLISDILEVLRPFDHDGSREKAAEVSVSRVAELQAHCEAEVGDSVLVLEMKDLLRHELTLMNLVAQVLVLLIDMSNRN